MQLDDLVELFLDNCSKIDDTGNKKFSMNKQLIFTIGVLYLTTNLAQLKVLSLANTNITNNSLALIADNLLNIEYLSVEFAKVDDIEVLSRCEKLLFLQCGTQTLPPAKVTLWRQANRRVKVATSARNIQQSALQLFCEL